MNQRVPISRVQEAIVLAKAESDPRKQAVLVRILEQRIRLKTEAIAKAESATAHAARNVNATGDRQPRKRRPRKRRLLQIASTLAYGNSLLMAGRNFALQHPLAVGFALVAGLVIAPKSLLRTTIRILPLVLRFGR